MARRSPAGTSISRLWAYLYLLLYASCSVPSAKPRRRQTLGTSYAFSSEMTHAIRWRRSFAIPEVTVLATLAPSIMPHRKIWPHVASRKAAAEAHRQSEPLTPRHHRRRKAPPTSPLRAGGKLWFSWLSCIVRKGSGAGAVGPTNAGRKPLSAQSPKKLSSRALMSTVSRTVTPTE